MRCVNTNCVSRHNDGKNCSKCRDPNECVYWLEDTAVDLMGISGSGPFRGKLISYKPIKKETEGKLKLHLVPRGIVEAVARVREFGMTKYKEENGWKQNTEQDYWNAVLRHIEACRNNMWECDSESGLPHLEHVACDLAFLLSKELHNAR